VLSGRARELLLRHSAGVHPRCQGRKELEFYLDGKVKQADLAQVFGVSAISVKRAVKLYEEAGPGVFWRPRPTRGPSVLTGEVLKQA
jgi:hypothetical protein